MPSPVERLVAAGALSHEQMLLAKAWARQPDAFDLAPTFRRILHDLLILERPLGEVETERGWSQRSGKVVLRVILDAMEAREGDLVPSAAVEDLSPQELLEWVCGDDPAASVDLRIRFHLTPLEQRLVLILQAAGGRVLTREQIMRRLYVNASLDEYPAEKIVDVLVSKVRVKLERHGAPFRIVTMWGSGYSCQDAPAPTPEEDAAVLAEVAAGRSAREVAAARGVQTATVLRAVRRAEARRAAVARGGAAR